MTGTAGPSNEELQWKAVDDEVDINEIEHEYEKIDSNWMSIQNKITVGMVLFAFFVEIALSIAIVQTSILKTTLPIYFWKYIVAPLSVNGFCLLCQLIIMKNKTLLQKRKIWAVTFFQVLVCFVLLIVHGTFSATYFIFAIPIMVTTVYADRVLTTMTGILSAIGLIACEFFIDWNSQKQSVFDSDMRLMNFLVSLFVLITFTIVCHMLIYFEKMKNATSIRLEKERRILHRKVHIDDLTGIYNRKALHQALKEIEEEKDKKPVLVMADVDHFKKVNDTFGHQAGDLCLVHVAKIMSDLALDATIFRYGGDEFCILFVDKDIVEVMDTCEEIRNQIRKLKFEEFEALKLSASFGLAPLAKEMDGLQLIVHSDAALYQAKKQRNKVRIFHPNDMLRLGL